MESPNLNQGVVIHQETAGKYKNLISRLWESINGQTNIPTKHLEKLLGDTLSDDLQRDALKHNNAFTVSPLNCARHYETKHSESTKIVIFEEYVTDTIFIVLKTL
jgi:hypothetical protein